MFETTIHRFFIPIALVVAALSISVVQAYNHPRTSVAVQTASN